MQTCRFKATHLQDASASKETNGYMLARSQSQ